MTSMTSYSTGAAHGVTSHFRAKCIESTNWLYSQFVDSIHLARKCDVTPCAAPVLYDVIDVIVLSCFDVSTENGCNVVFCRTCFLIKARMPKVWNIEMHHFLFLCGNKMQQVTCESSEAFTKIDKGPVKRFLISILCKNLTHCILFYNHSKRGPYI